MTSYDTVFPHSVYERASNHLLQFFRVNKHQEELCFALWHPSTGKNRYTAIVSEIIEPKFEERDLHGNVEFEAEYLSRSLRLAIDRRMGLAFMHSHYTAGWQDTSNEDIVAERDKIAPASAATQLPLVGLTMGTDGSLSARFWLDRSQSSPVWCSKVRVVGPKSMKMTYNDSIVPAYKRREQLKRTIDSWGLPMQQQIARLRIGIVGLGSVGSVVAESLARMGVADLVLIDDDKVELHNLDRLLNAGPDDVGTLKVRLGEKFVRQAATAKNFKVTPIAENLQSSFSYHSALDCDLLFSCVDRPLAKDLLNHIAYAHCIPVVFGGVYIGNKSNGRLAQATWNVSIIAPGIRCLRCDGQYSTSEVVMERDGSWGNPTYLKTHNNSASLQRNQNVFPFSANLGSYMVMAMIRYIIAEEWWQFQSSKTVYDFIQGNLKLHGALKCLPHCSIYERTSAGDTSAYPFIDKALK